MEDGAGVRKKVVKVSWTEEEVEMLFKGRDDGKDWDTIHAVSFTSGLLTLTSGRSQYQSSAWYADIRDLL